MRRAFGLRVAYVDEARAEVLVNLLRLPPRRSGDGWPRASGPGGRLALRRRNGPDHGSGAARHSCSQPGRMRSGALCPQSLDVVHTIHSGSALSEVPCDVSEFEAIERLGLEHWAYNDIGGDAGCCHGVAG